MIGVSADPQEKSDRFAKSLGLPYPMVGDPHGKILRAFGVRWPLVGLARRASFLVGRDRTVRAAFRSERDPEAHVTKALEAARALSR